MTTPMSIISCQPGTRPVVSTSIKANSQASGSSAGDVEATGAVSVLVTKGGSAEIGVTHNRHSSGKARNPNESI